MFPETFKYMTNYLKVCIYRNNEEGIMLYLLCYRSSILNEMIFCRCQAALSLFGMIGGPLLGLFILGMMFPWANKWVRCLNYVATLSNAFYCNA